MVFWTWPERTHCYLARNWADWWRIKTYFSREKTQILKNHFGHPILKFRQWIEVLQQLFRVFVLFVSASLYANLYHIWGTNQWKNMPVSLLLLVTCLFFLRVEYNDFNFSSEWGLAGRDQNQPRPDISKNQKTWVGNTIWIELYRISLSQSTFGLFTGYRKIMMRHKYIGCLIRNNLNRYSMNCSYVKHFAQNHLKRTFPEVAQNLDWRQNKQKGFLPLGSLDYRKLHQ